LDIGVLGYIGIVQHKEHSPEVFHIPPGTPCIYIYSNEESHLLPPYSIFNMLPYIFIRKYSCTE